MFVLSSLSITKKNKIIILVLLLLIASVVVLYFFNLTPFNKEILETTNNIDSNTAVQTTNEDRSIVLPNQIDSSRDCVILDRANCSLGKPIYEDNQLVAVGFNLPLSSVVYVPFKAKYEINTSLVLNGIGYPGTEFMDITKDDWGNQKTRSYFYVISGSPLVMANQTDNQMVTEKQIIMVVAETSKVKGDYNLILTFRQFNSETGQWQANLDLLKQYFPNL